MEINKNKYNVMCDECKGKGEASDLKFRAFLNVPISLCDECLQELNRKLVEYLAEDNL